MRFFYVHFPKAGGTSLHTQLSEKFAGRIVADYDHDPLGGNEAWTETSLPDHIAGVYGHLHPARYVRWSNFLFTMLRDPVENLISIYYFWKDYPSVGHPVHDRFLSEKPGLVEFATGFPLRNLMSEAYFGGFDMGRFDFIGFHEEREKSFRTLSDAMGVELDGGFHANRTNPAYDGERDEIRSNAALRPLLRDTLRADLTFYEAMRAKWA